MQSNGLPKKGLKHHRLAYSPPQGGEKVKYVVDIQDYETSYGGAFWRVQLWNTHTARIVEQRDFPVHEERRAVGQGMQWLAGAALGYFDGAGRAEKAGVLS